MSPYDMNFVPRMIAGIPWYPREQWSRWKEISADRADILRFLRRVVQRG
jgi:hypothetical protein